MGDYEVGQRIHDDAGGRYLIVDKVGDLFVLLTLRLPGYGDIEILPMDPAVTYTIITD